MESSLQILLADNEEIVHQIIADYLHDSGHRIDRVHDECAVMRAIRNIDYDMALIDMRFLNAEKISLLNRMREVRPEMPAIVIIGRQDVDIAIQAMRHGAIDFLTKPVKLLELDAALEKSIRHRSLVVQCMKTEKSLRESERRYSLLAENMTDIIWLTDVDLHSVHLNCDIIHMLGHDIEESATLTWAAVLTPASLKIAESILSGRTVGEEIEQTDPTALQSVKIGMLCKDGSVCYVDAKYAFLCNSEGQSVGMFGIPCDTTKCRK